VARPHGTQQLVRGRLVAITSRIQASTTPVGAHQFGDASPASLSRLRDAAGTATRTSTYPPEAK
jgi:hypothetical protein